MLNGQKKISVNGEKIVDIIDYRFLTNDEEIVLEIQKPNGEVWDYEIEKDFGEELGLELDLKFAFHNLFNT